VADIVPKRNIRNVEEFQMDLGTDYLIFNIISSTFSTWLEWSPAQLTGYANEVLLSKAVPEHALSTSLIAFACIIVLLGFSVFIFRKKELAS
jgi:ABC-2 type transport system permease protein